MIWIKGYFQISLYLFLLIIETMAIPFGQNHNIRGIPIEENELKNSLLADDSTSFWMALKVVLIFFLLP